MRRPTVYVDNKACTNAVSLPCDAKAWTMVRRFCLSAYCLTAYGNFILCRCESFGKGFFAYIFMWPEPEDKALISFCIGIGFENVKYALKIMPCHT